MKNNKRFKFNLNLQIPFLIILMVSGLGCNFQKGSSSEVKVEEASLNDEGIALDSIPAAPYTANIDESIFTSNTASSAITTGKAVLPASNYYCISNKVLLSVLKEKLPSSYLELEDLYHSAVANNKSFHLYPELENIYKFKVKVNDASTDYISFSLSDAFAGYGVLIQERGGILSTYSGLGKILDDDVFDATTNIKIFKSSGGSSFYAFKAESGAKIFGIGLSGGVFKLNSLAASLPTVGGTAKVIAERVSPNLVGTLGASVQLNGTIIYYADSSLVISHIYFMNSDFVTKEIIGQCAGLTSAGLLPSGLSCSASFSAN